MDYIILGAFTNNDLHMLEYVETISGFVAIR